MVFKSGGFINDLIYMVVVSKRVLVFAFLREKIDLG
jgi:hypothetical protein